MLRRDAILNQNDLFTYLSPCKLPGVKDQEFYFCILGKECNVWHILSVQKMLLA